MAVNTSLILFNVIAAATGGLLGGILGYQAGREQRASASQPSSIRPQLQAISQNALASRAAFENRTPSADSLLALLDSARERLVSAAQELQTLPPSQQSYFRGAFSELSTEHQNEVYRNLFALYSTGTSVLRSMPLSVGSSLYRLILQVIRLGEYLLLEELVGTPQRVIDILQGFNEILVVLERLKATTPAQKEQLNVKVGELLRRGSFVWQNQQMVIGQQVDARMAFRVLLVAMQEANIP